MSSNLTPWPQKQVERLIEFYEDGRPVSEIAEILSKEFRCKITRGAVLGKINRMRKAGHVIERIIL